MVGRWHELLPKTSLRLRNLAVIGVLDSARLTNYGPTLALPSFHREMTTRAANIRPNELKRRIVNICGLPAPRVQAHQLRLQIVEAVVDKLAPQVLKVLPLQDVLALHLLAIAQHIRDLIFTKAKGLLVGLLLGGVHRFKRWLIIFTRLIIYFN